MANLRFGNVRVTCGANWCWDINGVVVVVDNDNICDVEWGCGDVISEENDNFCCCCCWVSVGDVGVSVGTGLFGDFLFCNITRATTKLL